MSNSNLPSSSSPIPEDQKFFEACHEGNLINFKDSIDRNPDILPSTTPHENNCLHIAAMFGHDVFITEVWSRDHSTAASLFCGTNVDGETPLIAALMAANKTFARDIITKYHTENLEEGKSLSYMLLKVDRRGESALHHALRNGFNDLALELLEREGKLSEKVMKTGESPMYMAARRGYAQVVEKLLDIKDSADCGTIFGSAMHAAVRFNHPGIVEKMLRKRPKLAYCQDSMGMTPLLKAISHNNLVVVKLFLKYDRKLAYIRNEKTHNTPFLTAARHGSVSIAQEIMSVCPDSVYTPNKDGHNALHVAIQQDKPDFINYILTMPQLQRLINQADNSGSLPLHHAAEKCDPKLIRSFLAHERQDSTAVNLDSNTAVHYVTTQAPVLMKTLKWNESFTLLSNLNPPGLKQFSTIKAKRLIKEQSNEEVKSRIEKYTSNTSLVAALLATITFAAAFTLPGGWTSAGYPFFASKRAFQAFLICDTIAMCCYLTVTFLCILLTWEDMDFLLNYRKITRVLMWCAYEATGIAFGTRLYTVLNPHHNRLAFPILVICVILPFLTMLIAIRPSLMLWWRLGRLYQGSLVPSI